MAALGRRPDRDEAGFTLVELLLSLTLMGLIAGPLIGAIFVVMQNSSYTLGRATSRGTAQDQLVSSHDQELLDSAFAADAQSSATVSTVKPLCAVMVTGVATTGVIGFTWSESSGGAENRKSSAWYYTARPRKPDGTADLGQLGALHRATCSALPATPGAALPGTAHDVTVSRALGPTTPTVTCDGTVPTPTCAAGARVVALRIGVGLDSSTTFGVQGQRRLVVS